MRMLTIQSAVLGVVLALTLQVQEPPRTVALRLGPEPIRTEIITVVEAEREHRQLSRQSTLTDEQQRRLAALTIALGTLSVPVDTAATCQDTPARCETIRGHRLPAQLSP